MGDAERRQWQNVLLLPFFVALCMGILFETDAVSAASAYYPRVVSTGGGMLGLLTLGLVTTNFFSNALHVSIKIGCNVLRRLSVAEWRIEKFKQIRMPLTNMTQALLQFLAVNLLAQAFRRTAFPPWLYLLMDRFDDVYLPSAEMQSIVYRASLRALYAYCVLQLALLLLRAKSPPRHRIRQEERLGPWGKLLSDLQSLENRRYERKNTAQNVFHASQLVNKLLTLFIWAAVVVCWRALLGVRLPTFLAIGGVGGLALSLATKSIVQNLTSGGMIFLNRALVEGEEISTLDGKIHGIVEDIGPLVTVLNRPGGEPLIVPNVKLVENEIINMERRDFWLVEQHFPLVLPDFTRLGTVMEAMEKRLTEITHMVNPDGASQQTTHGIFEKPIVSFDGYGVQGATITVRAFLDGHLTRHEFYKVRSDILLEMSDVALSFGGVAIGLRARWIGGGSADSTA